MDRFCNSTDVTGSVVTEPSLGRLELLSHQPLWLETETEPSHAVPGMLETLPDLDPRVLRATPLLFMALTPHPAPAPRCVS